MNIPKIELWITNLNKNRFVLLLAPIGEILLIWLLISVNEFVFPLVENETDILPYAKQAVNHDWLPKDWYLNLNIDYRYPFNLILGHLISWFGFEIGAYIGRLLGYLFVAVAFYFFLKVLKLRISFGFLILLLYLNRFSVVAIEWMVRTAETKTIAYAFVILSLAFFLGKHYRLGFASAGAAMTFHVLVGSYAIFCMTVAILLNKDWRSQWRQYIPNSWPFFITGLFGLKVMIEQIIPQKTLDATRAWEIYVLYRVPHHVLPSSWVGNNWKIKLILATGLFLYIYFKSKSNAGRFIAAYALGSVLLFLTGLTIYALGEISLLRFYWFRFPDTMIMFLSAVLITLFLNDFGEGLFTIPVLSNQIQSRVQKLLMRTAPIIITCSTIAIIFSSLYQLQTEYRYFRQPNTDPRISALEWISVNTPKQAVFLVDPTMSDFYLYAQRAMFVSWKHLPQSAGDILEWYKRIVLCNDNLSPTRNGFDSLEELRTNFYHLDEKQIRQIAVSYSIDYYLGTPEQELAFESVYSNPSFTVYKITDQAK